MAAGCMAAYHSTRPTKFIFLGSGLFAHNIYNLQEKDAHFIMCTKKQERF